ncbi:MAG: LysR substrate-binding domain-containing protein [Burkholderiales bacterium]
MPSRYNLARFGGELTDLRLGIARHIRLAASTAALNQFLPPLLAGYGRLRPDLRVDVEEQVSEGVVNALREGRADLGVFVQGPDTAGLDVLPFRTDELVLVLPAAHLLAAARTPIPFVELLAEDWITLRAGAAMLLALQQAALPAGLRKTRTLLAPNANRRLALRAANFDP